jgi:hypothetical protein
MSTARRDRKKRKAEEFWAHANHLSAFQCKLIMELALFDRTLVLLWSASTLKNEITKYNSWTIAVARMHKSVSVYWTLSKAQIVALHKEVSLRRALFALSIHKNAFLFSFCVR